MNSEAFSTKTQRDIANTAAHAKALSSAMPTEEIVVGYIKIPLIGYGVDCIEPAGSGTKLTLISLQGRL